MSDTGVYEYTPQVQLKILAVLWRDRQSYNLYRETIRPKYFSSAIHVDVCRIVFDYYEQYGKAPTLDVLVEEVTHLCSSTKSKSKLLNDYLNVVTQMSEVELYDLDYIRDKILSFGKRQALVDAIMESADILTKKPDTEYNKIEILVRQAMQVGEDISNLGLDIFEGVEERFIGYLNEDDVIERIPTGINQLDTCLGGGLGRSEMGCILAAPGRGKTTTLVSIGGAAVEEGYNVLHVSLENNEKQILRNYDLRLLRKDMDYVRNNIDRVLVAMNNIRKYRRGRLKVKKYPTKSITVNTLRGLLDQLDLVEDFRPDVLIVDYGALMKPLTSYSDKRNNIESVFEELRAIADEYQLALWTAAQGNRGALSKKIVTMNDLAECFAIANIVDVMVALCQTNREKQLGDMRMFLAKNRDNPDSLILSGRILYSVKKVEMDDIVDIADDDVGDEAEDWE